jgi:hypothetical protein
MPGQYVRYADIDSPMIADAVIKQNRRLLFMRLLNSAVGG